MHGSSLKNMEIFFDKYLKVNDKILDVGSLKVSKQITYKDVLPKGKTIEYTGLDIEPGDNVDIVVEDIYKWKNIEDNTFNIAISGQAFEHIEFFWETFKEITRVVKKEGYICIIAPSEGPYHKYPVDCWRFRMGGMEALAKYSGIKLINTYICEKNNIWKDCVGVFKK